MVKRLEDLTEAQKSFIEGYVNGICAFLAKGPRGEPPSETEREFKLCVDMMYEDEEKLVNLAEDWMKGIIRVFTPPTKSAYSYLEWRWYKKPAHPEYIPLRGMRRIESGEIVRRRRERLKERVRR